MKKMIFLFLVLTTLCAYATPFISKVGRFSIDTPAPLMQAPTEMIEVPGYGKITLYSFFSADSDVVSYAIMYCDYPDIILKCDSQSILIGARDGGIANINGRLIWDLPIKISGFPAKECLAIATAGGIAFTVKIRLCLARTRLYQVMVWAAQGQVDSLLIDNFVNSFRINQ